jgi:hypothetical protein
MTNNENYFEKPEEIPFHRNPFYTGQKEEKEEDKKDESSDKDQQFFPSAKGRNLAPINRKLPEESGSVSGEADSGDAEKIKEWEILKKEFQKRTEKLKKEDQALEIDFHEVDFGIEFVVSSGGSRLCTGALSKDGMFLKSKKSGPEEETFFPSKKDQFLRKFEDLCSR